MRADKFFAEKYSSRTKAAEAIERRLVRVNGKFIKPSDEVSENDEVEFIAAAEEFVSNGGYKLSKALREFGFSPRGMIFADIGASTGGFTDCLLQGGAKKVYCVDVGESLLSPALAARGDVVQMQNQNARYLKKSDFTDCLSGVTVDASFISLKLLLPAISGLLPVGGVVLALIKPQFECGGKGLGKSGILPRSAHKKVILSVYDCAEENGLAPVNITNAPLREKKNIEYIIMLVKGGKKPLSRAEILNKAAALS